MTRTVEPLALAVLLMGMPALAGEERPSLQMLEFLASWESGDGGWIDPVLFYPKKTEAVAASNLTDDRRSDDKERDDE